MLARVFPYGSAWLGTLGYELRLAGHVAALDPEASFHIMLLWMYVIQILVYGILVLFLNTQGMSSGAEWSLEHALSMMEEPVRTCYEMMFNWFIERTGTVGKQLQRTDLPFPVVTFTPYAQRGIHVPSKQRYAANVTVKNKSISLRGPITASADRSLASPLATQGRAEEQELAQAPAKELLKDIRTFETVSQAIRKGQQRFKKELIRAYGGACAMTRCSVLEVLQAAHIIGYRGLATNVVNNGLLLRADVHLLYDRGLLTVSPDDYVVTTSNRLDSSIYAQLDGTRLTIPNDNSLAPNRDYLSVKYQEFEMMNCAS